MSKTSQPTPSNHQSTVAQLFARAYRYCRSELTTTLEFESQWNRIRQLCGDGRCMSSEQAWSEFEAVLQKTYKQETDFDQAIFGALRRAVTSFNGNDTKRLDDDFFPIQENSIVGIARQVNRKRLGLEGYGIISNCIHDHCVVVQKDDDAESGPRMWVNTTTSVELKMRSSNCEPIDPIRFNLKDNGAFAQALSYVASDVANCLARFGLLPDKLPIVILSGMSSSGGRLACVHGQLNIPERAGDKFAYTILGQVAYPDLKTEEIDDVIFYKPAMAMYLNSLVFGLEMARKIEALTKPILPSVLCGQYLQLGRREHCLRDWKLCASPIPSSPIIVGDTGNRELATDPDSALIIRIGQGELFSGKASLAALRHAVKSDKGIWFDLPMSLSSEPEVDVLVKVSSLATHNVLVHPSQAHLSLSSLRENQECRQVNGVLLGAIFLSEISMITIMYDLRKQGFTLLCPAKLIRSRECTSVELWDAFGELVKGTLLPLAASGVVHGDIRPGWDETANILCRCQSGRTPTMHLIDYESLIDPMFELPADSRSFRPTHQSGSNLSAFDFLWWQVISLAYAWLERKYQKKVDIPEFVARLSNKELGVFGTSQNLFTEEFSDLLLKGVLKGSGDDSDIDDSMIIQTIDHVREMIDKSKLHVTEARASLHLSAFVVRRDRDDEDDIDEVAVSTGQLSHPNHIRRDDDHDVDINIEDTGEDVSPSPPRKPKRTFQNTHTHAPILLSTNKNDFSSLVSKGRMVSCARKVANNYAVAHKRRGQGEGERMEPKMSFESGDDDHHNDGEFYNGSKISRGSSTDGVRRQESKVKSKTSSAARSSKKILSPKPDSTEQREYQGDKAALLATENGKEGKKNKKKTNQPLATLGRNDVETASSKKRKRTNIDKFRQQEAPGMPPARSPTQVPEKKVMDEEVTLSCQVQKVAKQATVPTPYRSTLTRTSSAPATSIPSGGGNTYQYASGSGTKNRKAGSNKTNTSAAVPGRSP